MRSAIFVIFAFSAFQNSLTTNLSPNASPMHIPMAKSGDIAILGNNTELE